MCVPGTEAECCVKLLDKPGSALGVPHGCCALRRKQQTLKLHHYAKDKVVPVSGTYITGININIISLTKGNFKSK